MGIRINITGTKIDGEAKVLNNLNVNKGNVNVDMQNTKIGGKSQIFNNMDVREGNVNVEMNNDKFTGTSKILNDTNIENGTLNVELNDVTIDNDVKFMNGRTFTSTGKQEQHYNHSNSKQPFQEKNREIRMTTQENQTVEKSFIKKVFDFIKRMVKGKKNINSNIQTSAKTSSTREMHRKYEQELSRNGELKGINIDFSQIAKNDEQIDQTIQKGNERS